MFFIVLFIFRRHIIQASKENTKKGLPKDDKSLAEQRVALRKKIHQWKTIQAIYMPGLLQYLHYQEYLKPGSTVDSGKSEEQHLWLPSSLPAMLSLCIWLYTWVSPVLST